MVFLSSNKVGVIEIGDASGVYVKKISVEISMNNII